MCFKQPFNMVFNIFFNNKKWYKKGDSAAKYIFLTFPSTSILKARKKEPEANLSIVT